MQKMKQESVRHREQEQVKTREISQMKKMSRKNETRIKALEAEKRLKENALRRKTEEVSALRWFLSGFQQWRHKFELQRDKK